MTVGPVGTIQGRTWRGWSRRQVGVAGCLGLLLICGVLALVLAIATDDDDAADESQRRAWHTLALGTTPVVERGAVSLGIDLAA